MAKDSSWVRPLVGIAALFAMILPLLASGTENETLPAGEEIRGLLKEQVEAWNRGDLEGFVGVYSRRPEAVFASGDHVTRGWKAVLDRYRKHYPTLGTMGHLDYEILQIDLLGTTYAKVLGRWDLAREGDSLHGLFTLIFAHGADGWRIIHDHTSIASPPAEETNEP